MRRVGRFVFLVAALGSLLATGVGSHRILSASDSSDAFVFSYFKGNGDGLHLAYSFDGLEWEPLNNDRVLRAPAVGRDKLMRDPQITLGPDATYHMVWTTSWAEPLIGHATSRDLIHWSAQQSIAPMTHEPGVGNVWAPETFYDTGRKQFVLFWASTIPGRFPETDNSNGNGRNHRIYYTTTRDFREFAPTQLLHNDGFNCIDATIIKDGNRFVMFIKDETRLPVARKNIRFAVSGNPAGPYGPASSPITGNYWAEGPSATKIGNRWIVYFDRYIDHRYGAVASSDFRHWEDVSDQLRFPEGARHGSVLRVPRELLTKLLELK